MKISIFLCIVLYSASVQAADSSFQFLVRHDHFWRSGEGQLTFSRDGVAFESENDTDHARTWTYSDIQEIKISSPNEVLIRTYEDVVWKLNQDRYFRFQLLDQPMGPEVVRFIRDFVPGRLVSAVFTAPQEASEQFPAKHLHTLGGGCRGQLLFTERQIYFSSEQVEHNREWLITEVESVGRRSPFSLRITVREKGLRNFQFQLLQPMAQETYERFWRQVHEPRSWLDGLAATER